MDALKLLTSDHAEVERMLEEIAATTERAVKTREETFGKIHA